ncbi:phosphoribosylglycinamide formyltransferase [Merismopedia glauca]|uniref:Phosphoribosylglycinamide formyltransferase n=1 Tax=Merismopedia glauca CCAP 1448/3 TaxID=1296344 RepID=A0A2T1C988_9CYAN|nr:phosphoribosylglycinamide formyltransferase [Merismopedia glauca]PSB04830.1 phosphoribosylglycinamide formyltransferase [Merismopedia glauca CCAP 1448/3]
MTQSSSPINFSCLVSPELSITDLSQSPPLRLGIMASGSGTNFEAIAQAIASKQLNAEVPVLIYNNPDAKVVARADKWKVPAILLNHRNFSSREALDREIVATFQAHQVDVVVMAGWMRIITQVLIDAFPNRLINIHPSLLPSFRGLNAIEQALAYGVKVTGCTVHLVSLEVDSGPILIQAAVPVLADDTPETLHARIQVQEHRILPQAIAILAQQLSTQCSKL